MQSIRLIVGKNGYIISRAGESYGAEYVAKNLEEVKNLFKELLDPIELEAKPKLGRPAKKKRSRPHKTKN